MPLNRLSGCISYPNTTPDSGHDTKANQKKYIKVEGRWRFVPVGENECLFKSFLNLFLACLSQLKSKREANDVIAVPLLRQIHRLQ